jgi:hypothetical protein|tara:strand:+ start:876 stop:1985 length:1110 start_codon:yes stop_codon:yes gene_type:complete
MKNFLIEFFRPLDNLIFNYLVKIGAIKPWVTALIGAAAGIYSSRKARKSAEKSSKKSEDRARADLNKAFKQIRDPYSVLRGAYGKKGIYGSKAMDRIYSRERELIPQFQELAELRARGIRDIQEESKLRQLGLLGSLGGVSRELLEDPRLAEIAEMDIAEAQRLGMEAGSPLSGERAREAEQTALQMAVRQGRGRGEGAIAQAVLGRTAAKTQLEEQAARARQRALQSSTAAMVDPSSFLFAPTVEEQLFISAGLGPQVTDPGQAINVGSARDVQRANILIGQGTLAAQAGATRADIAAQQGATLGKLFSGFGSRGSNQFGGGYGTQAQSQPFPGFTGDPSTSIFGKGLTGDPTTNILGNFLGKFGLGG